MRVFDEVDNVLRNRPERVNTRLFDEVVDRNNLLLNRPEIDKEDL